MRREIALVFLALCFSLGMPRFAAGEDQKKFSLPELKPYILQEADLPEYPLQYQHVRTGGGKTIIEQCFNVPTGGNLIVSYARFSAKKEALMAAENERKRISNVTQEGSYTGMKVGDKSWISKSGCSISFVQDNILVVIGSISVSTGSEDEGRKSIDKIARFLAEKIRKVNRGNPGREIRGHHTNYGCVLHTPGA